MARAPKDKPLPPPDPLSITHEFEYRGYRVVQTDDPAMLTAHPDKWGFVPSQAYVVINAFDEHVMPIGMHWFYTPDDAVAAIEMLDTILPQIKEGQAFTTLLHEYGVMRAYRREFAEVYRTLLNIKAKIDAARAFDDNPAEDIDKELHLLRQNVARGRSIG